jgi:hypothetical protein
MRCFLLARMPLLGFVLALSTAHAELRDTVAESSRILELMNHWSEAVAPKCTGASPLTALLSEERPPIINGREDTDNEYPNVVPVWISGGLCTATLVAPDTLVTAANCFVQVYPNWVGKRIVQGTVEKKASDRFEHSTVLRPTDSEFLYNGRRVPIAEVRLHNSVFDGILGFSRNDPVRREEDIAIIKLGRNLSALNPAQISYEPRLPRAEATLVGCGTPGFFQTSRGSFGMGDSGSRKEFGITMSAAGVDGTFLAGETPIRRIGHSRVGNVQDGTIYLEEETYTGSEVRGHTTDSRKRAAVSKGDSGGPLFDQNGKMIGVAHSVQYQKVIETLDGSQKVVSTYLDLAAPHLRPFLQENGLSR